MTASSFKTGSVVGDYDAVRGVSPRWRQLILNARLRGTTTIESSSTGRYARALSSWGRIREERLVDVGPLIVVVYLGGADFAVVAKDGRLMTVAGFTDAAPAA